MQHADELSASRTTAYSRWSSSSLILRQLPDARAAPEFQQSEAGTAAPPLQGGSDAPTGKRRYIDSSYIPKLALVACKKKGRNQFQKQVFFLPKFFEKREPVYKLRS